MSAAIGEQLAGGDPRTLRNVDAVIGLVRSHPDRLAELVACVTHSDDPIVRMRAADALEKLCRANPILLQPYATVILGPMARIDQPSVQWHVAQMLGQLQLTSRQRAQAARILARYLDRASDWIVLNCSLETLAILSRQDPTLTATLRHHLHQHEHSSLRSLTNRVRKLLAEFGPP